LQIDQGADVAADRIDGGIERLVVKGLERRHVAGCQNAGQFLDRLIGGGHRLLDLVGERLLVRRHAGGLIGAPGAVDPATGVTDLLVRRVWSDQTRRRLVGRIDDVDGIEVADGLELLQRRHAIGDHRLHALLSRAHAHGQRRQAAKKPSLDRQLHGRS